MESLSLKDFIEKISKGTIFTVNFIKRSTGEERTLNGRWGVEKFLAGGQLKYDPLSKGLLVLFDLGKGEYRQVSIEGIKWVHLMGKKYHYNSDKQEFVVED